MGIIIVCVIDQREQSWVDQTTRDCNVELLFTWRRWALLLTLLAYSYSFKWKFCSYCREYKNKIKKLYTQNFWVLDIFLGIKSWECWVLGVGRVSSSQYCTQTQKFLGTLYVRDHIIFLIICGNNGAKTCISDRCPLVHLRTCTTVNSHIIYHGMK